MAQFCELLNEEKLYKHIYLEVILDHKWSLETQVEVHANAMLEIMDLELSPCDWIVKDGSYSNYQVSTAARRLFTFVQQNCPQRPGALLLLHLFLGFVCF